MINLHKSMGPGQAQDLQSNMYLQSGMLPAALCGSAISKIKGIKKMPMDFLELIYTVIRELD